MCYLSRASHDASDGDELSDAISLDLTDGRRLGVGGTLEVDFIPTHQLLGKVVCGWPEEENIKSVDYLRNRSSLVLQSPTIDTADVTKSCKSHV